MHVAVSTVNESCAVRETRKAPSEVAAVAADPTDERTDEASTVIDTTRPDTVAGTDESGGAVVPDEEVGLPPQAPKAAPATITEAA